MDDQQHHEVCIDFFFTSANHSEIITNDVNSISSRIRCIQWLNMRPKCKDK